MTPPRSPLGVASTCYLSYRKFTQTVPFVAHVIALGAAGAQMAINPPTPETARRIRELCDRNGIYFEAMAPLPKEDSAGFAATLQLAKDAGAQCARVGCLGGRRYETFSSMEEWQRFVAASHSSLELAVPAAEKVGIPLALENHKDWTASELVALIRKFSSPSLGVCLDTGNNISLLDDPYELVEALAPYALATHIKDMGVAPSPDGFLLSELPLRTGALDMRRIIATIRKARPRTNLTLEMISRNPLRVPCLGGKYWATMPDRPAPRLAATLDFVRLQQQPLPTVDALSPGARLDWEEENVRACLTTAREMA